MIEGWRRALLARAQKDCAEDAVADVGVERLAVRLLGEGVGDDDAVAVEGGKHEPVERVDSHEDESGVAGFEVCADCRQGFGAAGGDDGRVEPVLPRDANDVGVYGAE